MTSVKTNQVSNDAKEQIAAALQTYTRAEVAQHKTKDDCWFVYKNEVYNVTKFIPLHPAGPNYLLDYAGLDTSIAFDQAGHSETAYGLLDKYKIGNVPKDEFLDPSEMATQDLEPKWDQQAVLTKKVEVSKDSAIFTFKFKETFELDLKPGQHITFVAEIDG